MNEFFHMFGQCRLVEMALEIEDGFGCAKIPTARRGV
jgi:hypothetical protein